MEEKIIIQSDSHKTKKKYKRGLIIGLILSIGGFAAYLTLWELLDKTVSNAAAGAITEPMCAIMIIGVIIAIIYGIFYADVSKCKMFVTANRVYGHAAFGKKVELPVDSITAVGLARLNAISVSTPSGRINFAGIDNKEEIYDEINKLLVHRQNKPIATTTIKQEIPQSNADELKKYKELLDSGVITQEEFDAKKKQLLGL